MIQVSYVPAGVTDIMTKQSEVWQPCVKWKKANGVHVIFGFASSAHTIRKIMPLAVCALFFHQTMNISLEPGALGVEFA